MRQKPSFTRSASTNGESLGCVWIPVIAVIGYFIISAISRVTSGGGSRLDRYICYASLLFFFVILLMGLLENKRSKKVTEEKKQEWKRTSRSALVAILDRHYYPGGSYEDEYGIPHNSHASCRLYLEPNADQIAVSPNQKTIIVELDLTVYSKLQDRNTVQIYYRPEAPLTFFLEEELI